MPRVFIGLELPETVKRPLLDLRQRIAGARWQSAGQLHLTLRFLGAVDGQQLALLRAALAGLPVAPFDLVVSRTGSFGNPEHPRNLWAGVAAEPALMTLHDEISGRLAMVGWPAEARRFRPHITLARFGREAGSVAGFIEQHRGLALEPFMVEGVSLFESTQTPEGSCYTVIGRFPLAGGLPEDSAG